MDDLNKFSLDNLDTNQEFNLLKTLSNSELFSTVPNIDDNIDDSPYLNTDIHCKYMDENCFTSKYKNLNSISYMSLNIQSLHAKFTLFQEFIQNLSKFNCQPDVILIQETWQIIDPSYVNLAGYQFIYKTRKSSQGGGVGIYIKEGLRYKILDVNSVFIDRIIETLFIELWPSNSNNKKIVIGSVYRPAVNHPTLSSSDQFLQFLDIFSTMLDGFAGLNDHVLIGGDFNLDALKYRINHNVTNYIDMLFSYGFLQLIMKPTRCTIHSATLIDHFISNVRADLHDTVILTSKLSDHFPIIYISKNSKLSLFELTIYWRSSKTIKNSKNFTSF